MPRVDSRGPSGRAPTTARASRAWWRRSLPEKSEIRLPARTAAKASPLAAMAFILAQARTKHLPAAVLNQFQTAEVIQKSLRRPAEHLHTLLGVRLVPVSEIADRALRTVGELQGKATLPERTDRNWGATVSAPPRAMNPPESTGNLPSGKPRHECVHRPASGSASDRVGIARVHPVVQC